MKIAKGFKLKTLQGKEGEKEKGVVITVGEASKKLNGVITLNETATYIFQAIESGKSVEEMANEMLKEYEVEKDVLIADILEVVEELRKIGAIDD